MEQVKWTAEIEARFHELRLRELSGALSETEKRELAQLVTVIEAEEAEQLVSVISQLQSEQAGMRTHLRVLQEENVELAKVLSQLEQLVVDARKWLAEFEHRHRLIRQSYARLTGEPVVHP
jgi:predicted  nucleic acid-binding Zn-ribbon protein